RDAEEIREFPGVVDRVVELDDLTVTWQVLDPGWRWSTHVRPQVGTDRCQARHQGIMLSGRIGVLLDDGTTLELESEDVYAIPPGHDAWVLGDEPAVAVEWAGIRTFYGHHLPLRG